VLEQLTSNRDVMRHVRKADVVEIEIGANDVAYNKSCGTSVECYAPKLPAMEANLKAIVRRTRTLVSGRKFLVVLLEYWSVWLGGKHAAAKGEAYVAAEEMTDRVDTAIASTAAKNGSAYVDLRAAFKGSSYAYDETHYLSSDGDHPNAAGHQKIAEAVKTVIEKRLAPLRLGDGGTAVASRAAPGSPSLPTIRGRHRRRPPRRAKPNRRSSAQRPRQGPRRRRRGRRCSRLDNRTGVR
jgi:lysophospholipase L1-like esterase